MLPPPDEAVLQSNPDFANLYKILTSAVLDSDGATKHDAAAKERAVVKQELDEHRTKAAKQHLIERAIATATPPEPKAHRAGERPDSSLSDLPESLLDLLLILPPLLEAEQAQTLSPESADLLLSSPSLADLNSLLPDLTALVSSNLHASAMNLARLAHPSTNPSFLHRHVSSLSQNLSDLSTSLSTIQDSLTAIRLRTVSLLTDLLQCYTQSLICLVRALEAKHGVVARSLELRASEISFQAQRGEVDSRQSLSSLSNEMYSPQVTAAIRKYVAHLKDARIRGAERLRTLMAELAEYGVGSERGQNKEKKMREMARVYGEMGRQLDDVKQDLERLEKR